MTIGWLNLMIAVALLLPPVPFSASFQKSLLSLRRRSLANAAAAARVWQNWVDFVRAGLGVWLLTGAIRADDKSPGGEFNVLALQAAVLGLVLLAQTVRVWRTVQIVAPIFYLCGVTFFLTGTIRLASVNLTIYQGAFAVAVGWVFAVAGKNLIYQLPAMAVALVAAGYVLGGGSLLLLMFNCGMIVLPFVLSTLFKKRLLLAARPAEVG